MTEKGGSGSPPKSTQQQRAHAQKKAKCSGSLVFIILSVQCSLVLRPWIFLGADARGATRVLDRSVQAVSRSAARCALHVHGCHGGLTNFYYQNMIPKALYKMVPQILLYICMGFNGNFV